MNDKIPLKQITIDEEYSEDGQYLGISRVAYTSKPAILTKGFAFSQQSKLVSFKDDLKYRIAGPIMIPMEIYRSDEEYKGEEYMAVFTALEIEKIHSKFMMDISNKDVFNLEHNDDNMVPSYVLESILVDSDNKRTMISSEYGIDVPLGTSFVVTQLTDKNYYNELVKTGKTGFSIEGFLGLKLSELKNGIETKNKETKMKENELLVGEYTGPNGKVFIMSEDGTMKPKDEEVKKEELAIDTTEVKPGDVKEEETTEEAKIKETELATEPVVEDEVKTDEVKTEEVISYTKEEVDAKFDDLYKVIADMKVAEQEEDTIKEEVSTEPVKLSANERFSEYVRFAQTIK